MAVNSTQSEKLEQLNRADAASASAELARCCGSTRWVNEMLASRPFATRAALFSAAEQLWHKLGREDWLEAFGHHPKIGDIDSLRAKFAATKQWAQGEQKGVEQASQQVLEALAQGNKDYEERFGYIFIVCATGKSADEMLALLTERLSNMQEDEIKVAMLEQAKITRIRLEKLLS